MKKKINIAEILKNCPSDMELYSTLYDNLYFNKIMDHNSIYQINCYTIADGIRSTLTFTKFGTINTHLNSKCVIFPKGKTTWEGFIPPCKFKDGDIVYLERYDDKLLAIFKDIENNYLHTYTYIGTTCICLSVSSFNINYIKDLRFATEEEKEKLFKELKHQDYCWNAETNILEKIIKPKFKVDDVIQDNNGYKVEITKVNIDDKCYEYISKIVNRTGAIDFKDQDEWELVPDEIKPKFKVGDRIKIYGYEYIIVEIKDAYYLTECGNKILIKN